MRHRRSTTSAFDDRKTVIRLHPSDLDCGDANLASMSAFIRHAVEQVDSSVAARNAGILYLALIHALENVGYLEYSWAAPLLLEIGSREFEVKQNVCSTEIALKVQIVLASIHDTVNTTETGRTRSDSTPAPQKRGRRQLDLLMVALATQAKPAVGVKMSQGSDVRMTPVQSRAVIGSTACVEGDELGAMAEIIRKVDMLDTKTAELSISTNRAYWDLGESYISFCKAHATDKSWSERPEQNRLFRLICEDERFRDFTKDPNARHALQKRLLRARKFVYLVESQGVDVLTAVPAVCVTNLDRISLKELRLLGKRSTTLDPSSEVAEAKLECLP